MNANIILIGMSGAGKSTLGVLLAKALGMNFVDTDILIQQREGRILQQIIDTDGIERFLEIEEEVLCAFSEENCVVATGGSAVYSENAMRALSENARVVYLALGYDEVAARLTNITTRGIVMRKGGTLRDVFDERVPLYERYADITIDCTDTQIEECVEKIIKALG